MFSKVVARQLEEATKIGSAAIKNADQVAERLAQHFAPRLRADQGQPDWKLVFDTLGRNLIEASDQLNQQESTYQTQLRLEKQLRERRDEAIDKVQNQLRGARYLLDQVFGKEKASILFPSRADLTRVVPRNLVPLAKAVVLLLRGSGVTWPPLDSEGHVPKPLELAVSLEAAVGELAGVLGELAPEKKGNVFLLGNRRAEFDATAKVISATALAVAGLFRVAGFDFAADRLRTKTRRRPKSEEEQGEPEKDDAMVPEMVDLGVLGPSLPVEARLLLGS